MLVFVLQGSKGGARRSTASLLLAVGLRGLGLNPLHIQVLAANRPPVLDGVADVPFETEWIEVEEGASAAMSIRRCAAGHPQCSPVVVDMPKERIRADLVDDADIRILLPMGDGATEIECAAHDYRDAAKELSGSEKQGRGADIRLPPAWFMPVGWPRSLRAEDFASILGRFGVAVEKGQHFPIILPAVPKLDPLDLDFVSDERDRFEFSTTLQDVAEALACAVLVGTDSPLLRALGFDLSGDGT